MDDPDVRVEERVPFLESDALPALEPIVFEKNVTPTSGRDKFLGALGIINWRWNAALQFRPQWKPPSKKQVRHLTLRFASWLVPSFLRKGSGPPTELHETAYLDGLRGYASYAVFFSHHISAYCNEGWHPYGEGDNNHFVRTDYFFQRPIIRMIYNGQAAVTIFFVLSGYVLSYKPLKLIHARDFENLQSNLSSIIFRRWSRLFLPVAALFIVNVFLVELGAFSWFDAYKVDNPNMPPGVIEGYLARGETFWGTAYKAYESYWEFVRDTFWTWTSSGRIPTVDWHMWTLHTEFRSSCILFLYLHGTSRMQPNLRLAFFLFSAAVCLTWDQWAVATFLAGSAIADLDLRMRRRRASSVPGSPIAPAQPTIGLLRVDNSSSRLGRLQDFAVYLIETQGDQLLWAMVFVWATLFLSYPTVGADRVAFYSFLSWLHPYTSWDLFFWLAVGGITMVFVSGRLRILQRGLETRFSQYIGKTSFALYLVHGTVIKTLGHFVVIQTWLHITGYSGWGYAMGIVLPFLLVVAPVTIVATDWFWRGVDIPTVNFGKWIERLVQDKTL